MFPRPKLFSDNDSVGLTCNFHFLTTFQAVPCDFVLLTYLIPNEQFGKYLFIIFVMKHMKLSTGE